MHLSPPLMNESKPGFKHQASDDSSGTVRLWNTHYAPSSYSNPAYASSTQSSDDDDEEIMAQLREARKRLESTQLDDTCLLGQDTDLIAKTPQAYDAFGLVKNSSFKLSRLRIDQQGEGDPPTKTSKSPPKNTAPDLTLNLKDLPFVAHIENERRRLSDGSMSSTISDLDDPTALERWPRVLASVPSQYSGSKFGLAPYIELERSEWTWHGEPASPTSSSGHRLSLPPSEASDVEMPTLERANMEWDWALGGSTAAPTTSTDLPAPMPS
ncbi:hypothetical protein ACI68E_004039 [Malassezia pachydermatis]|uniref:Uncharacterized protein n=1 Tax=Malassezia pachydermatis TaxID=77020 RepID=A0A0N0RRV1_9BASI|nr:hypothetical protein Malapachy_2844 [Malassezia pachydermatis]KOS12553.1 hypothetical protein Malapachy_2844 [Malassezia pachydermatis]